MAKKKSVVKKTAKKKIKVSTRKNVVRKKSTKKKKLRCPLGSAVKKELHQKKHIHPSSLHEIYLRNVTMERQISQKVMTNIASQAGMKDLPVSYNTTCLVLMVRDPYWVYAYWDLSAEKKKEIALFKEKHSQVKSVIRIHEVRCEDNACIAGNCFDIEVPLEVGQWYMYLGMPEHCFTADLGLVDAQGEFYLIAWSNQVTMPRDTPSQIVDLSCASNALYNELYQKQLDYKKVYFPTEFSKRKKSTSSL